ncbi:hypothetical protein G9A89_010950 [Geosiphon pyriformis]|nr:hypothetical protein G9A89_010950 [Geosiphon pyriformis]
MIRKSILKLRLLVSSSELSTQLSTISTELPIYDTTANLLTTNLSANKLRYLSTAVSTYLSVTVLGNLSALTNSNTVTELTSKWNTKAKTDTTKLEIETTTVPLFSGATLDTKLITVMYTDVKIDGHAIKLILDSGSADSIITQQLMDQLNWTIQELQLSQNSQHTQVPTTCGHFKTSNMPTPLIEFEKE